MKNRVRRILNGELNLLSSRITSQKEIHYERRIQPGRHASCADDVAIRDHPCIRKDSA
jgi:hypothetical protein